MSSQISAFCSCGVLSTQAPSAAHSAAAMSHGCRLHVARVLALKYDDTHGFWAVLTRSAWSLIAHCGYSALLARRFPKAVSVPTFVWTLGVGCQVVGHNTYVVACTWQRTAVSACRFDALLPDFKKPVNESVSVSRCLLRQFQVWSNCYIELRASHSA